MNLQEHLILQHTNHSAWSLKKRSACRLFIRPESDMTNFRLSQSISAKLIILIGDTLIALASLSASLFMHSNGGPTPLLRPMGLVAQVMPDAPIALPFFPMASFALLLLCTFYIFDLYDLRIFGQPTTLLFRLLGAGLALTAIVYSVSLAPFSIWRQIGILPSVAMAVTVAFAWRRLFSANHSVLLPQDSTAIIGAGPSAEYIRTLLQSPQSRYRFEGFVVTGDGSSTSSSVLGSISELNELVARHGIRQLVLATDSVPYTAEPTLSYLKFQGVGVHCSPDIAMELSRSLPVELMNHTWLRVAEKSQIVERHLMRKLKRLADVVLSVAALIFFMPLLVACAIAIKLESAGPVIFRQTRVGWRGQHFTIYKLRTMRNGSEVKPQWAAVNDSRITRVGRILRLTHIDELPQLINILRGHMSFVGPRPERPEFVKHLNEQIPFYDLRHCVLPGITGWAQVNFRYAASVADTRRKLEFDLYYVMHASLILDLLIFLKTIQVVLFMRGSR